MFRRCRRFSCPQSAIRSRFLLQDGSCHPSPPGPAVSDFRARLRAATEILATGVGDVKSRLGLAVTDQLMFANVPPDLSIPKRFRDEQAGILRALSEYTWKGAGNEAPRVRPTIHKMPSKTAATFARRIWKLYIDFEEYMAGALKS